MRDGAEVARGGRNDGLAASRGPATARAIRTVAISSPYHGASPAAARAHGASRNRSLLPADASEVAQEADAAAEAPQVSVAQRSRRWGRAERTVSCPQSRGLGGAPATLPGHPGGSLMSFPCHAGGGCGSGPNKAVSAAWG